MSVLFNKVLQIGLVVNSVDKTIKKYSDKYGIGPWKIWEYDKNTVENMTIRGKKIDYAMRIASTNIWNVEWEIIEPKDKKSVYAEFLDKYGEGIHHLALETENFNKTIEHLKNKGINIEQSGNWYGQHEFVYLNTFKDLKVIIELCKTNYGFKFPNPIKIYPNNHKENIPIFKGVKQIGFVVKNVRDTVKKYKDNYFISLWEITNKKEIILAKTHIGNVEWVLIEPKEYSTIYGRFLDNYGEGIYYVNFKLNHNKYLENKVLNNVMQDLKIKKIFLSE